MRAEGQQRDGEVFRGVVDSASVVGAEVCSWNARVCARKCSSLRAHPPGPVIAPVGAPGGYPSAGCFSNRSIQPPDVRGVSACSTRRGRLGSHFVLRTLNSFSLATSQAL